VSPDKINKKLDRLSEIAQDRMSRTDLTTLPNHTTYDFLTDEEKEERHLLLLQLPSAGEKMVAAQNRINKRIRSRRRRRALNE
jgi:hypothetical protein